MNITHTTLVAAISAVALSVPLPDDSSPGGDAATAETPVTAETMAGIWKVDDWPGVLNQLTIDGTFVFDFEGQIDTHPFGVGTYEIVDAEVIVTVANGACSDWAFHVDDLTADGRAFATYSRSGCGVGEGQPWDMTRLSPASAAGSAVVEPASVLDQVVTVSASTLRGIWLREGTGQLASFTADGSYAVDDGGLLGIAGDDVGTFEFDGEAIALTSDGGASCAGGGAVAWDGAVLDYVKFTEGATNTLRLRVTTADNECVGWTAGDQTWLRVSP